MKTYDYYELALAYNNLDWEAPHALEISGGTVENATEIEIDGKTAQVMYSGWVLGLLRADGTTFLPASAIWNFASEHAQIIHVCEADAEEYIIALVENALEFAKAVIAEDEAA